MKSLLCSLVCCFFIWCNAFAQADYSFYVSPIIGDDATGVVNNPSQPFEHIQFVLDLIELNYANNTYDLNTTVDVLLRGGEYYEQLSVFDTHIGQLTIKPATTNEAITIYGTVDISPDPAFPNPYPWVFDGNYPVPVDNCGTGHTIDELVYWRDLTINTDPPAPLSEFKKRNWLFRADDTQLYGYIYENFLQANLDGGDFTNDHEGLFFSTRMAEGHKGVGYTIQDHPNDPSKIRIYLAVDPDDDFIANPEPLFFTKTGPIIAIGASSKVTIDGGPNKLITLKHSETGVLAVSNLDNIVIKNLKIRDTKAGVLLRGSNTDNILVDDNDIMHHYNIPQNPDVEPCLLNSCDEEPQFPVSNSKNQIIESTGISVEIDESTTLNCVIQNNKISGGTKGISILTNNIIARHNTIEEVAGSGFEIESTYSNSNVECYGNFVKNAFNAFSFVTVPEGPVYIHENVIYNTRAFRKFGIANLCNTQDDCCEYVNPFKFGNVKDGNEMFYGESEWRITRKVHFYYNTVHTKGVPLNMAMQVNNPGLGATSSDIFNNIFYSSDGPCTQGAGEYCNGIVLRGNAFYTDRVEGGSYDYFPGIPTTTKYAYWGYWNNNGNDLQTLTSNISSGANCSSYALGIDDYYYSITQHDWQNNIEKKWNFPNLTMSSNQFLDFNPAWEDVAGILENVSDPMYNYPMMNPNRTIPGALEIIAENDNCKGALNIQANSNSSCALTYDSETYFATPSSGFSSSSCAGNINIDDDVWFKFTAVSTTHEVILSNATENLFYIVYESCSGTILSCNGAIGPLSNLTVGNEYIIRVFTVTEGVGTSFTICVNSPFGLAPGGGSKVRDAQSESMVGELQVFPNPNNGQFVWQFAGDDSPLVWMLFDPQGRKLQQANVQPADGQYTHHMNLRQLPKGLYLLSVQQGDHHYFEKIIVE